MYLQLSPYDIINVNLEIHFELIRETYKTTFVVYDAVFMIESNYGVEWIAPSIILGNNALIACQYYLIFGQFTLVQVNFPSHSGNTDTSYSGHIWTTIYLPNQTTRWVYITPTEVYQNTNNGFIAIELYTGICKSQDRKKLFRIANYFHNFKLKYTIILKD